MMLTDTPRQRGELVAAGARAHRWFKLGSDHEKCGAFRCGWLVVAVAGGVAERWRVPFNSPLSPSHFQSPRIGNHRQLI